MGNYTNTSQTTTTPVSAGHIVGSGSATEKHATNLATAGQAFQRYDFETGGFKFGDS
ncbi:MAG: hypothetical protein ABIP33_06405 [Pseudolysinimonas sp.]